MPVYEFYCKKCNIIFSFFSASVNTDRRPLCPECKETILERRMSLFSMSHHKKENEDAGPVDSFDEGKMEAALNLLSKEAEHMDENDPRQAAGFMRRFKDMTGMNLGPGMEEAIARMEAGEDPEKIEAEMGDLIDDNELFGFKQRTVRTKKNQAPRVDEKIYDL